MADQLLTFAESVLEKYGARIAEMLGLPPAEVTFKIGKTDEGVAQTNGTTITLDRSWFSQNLDGEATGALVHELVHAFQQDPNIDDKAIEPIADAVRAKLHLAGDQGNWVPDEDALRIARLEPWQIHTISQTMAAGTYDPGLIRQLESGQITREQVRTGVTPTSVAANEVNVGATTTGAGAYYVGQDGAAGGTGGDVVDFGAGGGNNDKKHQQAQNTRKGFINTLQLYGIPLSQQMQQLVNEATTKGYSQDRFLYYLRQTNDYQQTFPGIFNQDGTLKMDETQYLSNVQAYQSYAEQAGINLGDNKQAWLFQHDVSPDEFSDKATAIAMLRDNKDMYEQFAKALVQSGQAKPSEVTQEGLFKFVLGEGNKAWYQEWNLARARYVATQSGLQLKQGADRYLALNPGVIEKISNKGLTDEQLAQGFSQVSDQLGTVLPLHEAKTYGITKKDIIAAAFGGKNAEKARLKIKRATDTYEAFQSERASSQAFTDQSGRFSVLGRDTQRHAQSY